MIAETRDNNADGQERALATVTYIMSLSEMARTPFSLVDEINQVRASNRSLLLY